MAIFSRDGFIRFIRIGETPEIEIFGNGVEKHDDEQAIFRSQKFIRLRGKAIPGAEDRQGKIAGFDQGGFSKSHVLCIGVGGIVSNIAPMLYRKGIGRAGRNGKLHFGRGRDACHLYLAGRGHAQH
jgi:hypothetical protein